MKTYNFEQAVEAVAHGIKVTRLALQHDGELLDPEWDVQIFTLNDFYAQDWVAYEGD